MPSLFSAFRTQRDPDAAVVLSGPERDGLRPSRGRLLRLLFAAAGMLLLGSTAAFGLPVTSIPGTTAVGSSTTQAVTVTFTAAGTPSVIEAVSAGATGLDYSVSSNGTCSTGSSYSVGATCALTVSFAPAYPGRRAGAVRIKNSSGTLLAEALVSGNATGALPVLKPGRIDTVAGGYYWIYTSDNQAAIGANIFVPKAVVLDGAGNLFLSDTGNNRIRRVDASSGLISTYAGTGSPGFSGDGGAATSAAISAPSGLVLDGAGNLYFSDYQNHVVRCVDAVSGKIATVAGTGQTGGYSGDGAAATSARLNLPEGLALDASGNLLIADSANNVIRKVDASTGVISTIAGTSTQGFSGDGGLATAARLNQPQGVFAKADGTILIADTANQRLRRIGTDGKINTFMGDGNQAYTGDGGAPASAELNQPANIVVDPAGNIYVTDAGNNRVRMINVNTGNVETITGTNSETFAGDTGPADLASHYGPTGLFFAQSGDLYLTDMFHMRVRKISGNKLTLTYPTMRVGKTSLPKPAYLVNDGNSTLTLSTPVYVQSGLDAATTTCFGSSATTLTSGVNCGMGVQFKPTQVGNPITGTLTLPSNASAITPVITLTGEVLSVNPTTAVVSVVAPSTNPSIVGDNVTFKAQTSNGNAGALTGDVTFTVDGTTVCSTVALANDASATCTVSGLTLGTHQIVATYSGDTQNAAATSPNFAQVVKQQTTLALVSSANPVVVTQSVTFTVTASAATGTPTGTVTFSDGTTTLGTGTLNGSGQASLSLSNLTIGTHNIVVQYGGDASNAAATSAVLSQVVRLGNTSVLLSSSNSSIPVGQSFTLTATVSSQDGLQPTGQVVFTSYNAAQGTTTTLGTGTMSSSGVATITISNLLAGTYSITATYNGDSTNAASASTALTQVVNRLATVTSLTTDASPLSAGAVLHLTAQVVINPSATPYGTISGTVTFSDNGTALATVPLGSNGVATYAAAGMTVGTHTLVATYSGDANYLSSNASHQQVVVQTASSITVTTAATTVRSGQPASFVASVSSATGVPTGNVTFQEGSTTLGTAALTAGVASFSTSTLSLGQHTLTATYTGDANYQQSTSAPFTIQVVLATTNVTMTGPTSPVNVTTPVSFTTVLTSNGVTPTGTMTLLDGATQIATLPVTSAGTLTFSVATLGVGQHTLTATYSGDPNNAAATSASVSVQVVLASTTLALTGPSTPVTVTTPANFTTVLTSNGAAPTGTIVLLDGATQVATRTVTGTGTLTFSLTSLGVGQHTLVAQYSGDARTAAATSAAVTVQVITAATTTSLTTSATPATLGSNVTFTATVTSAVANLTGTVDILEGTRVLGTGTLANGTISVVLNTLGFGDHTLIARYSGDALHTASNSAPLPQRIINAATVTVTSSLNPAVSGQLIVFTATVPGAAGLVPTGTVVFSDGSTVLGTVPVNGAGVSTLQTSTLSVGTHTIQVSYSGDANFSSTQAGLQQVIRNANTSISTVVSSDPALYGANLDLTATVLSNGGTATGPVQFTEAGAVLGTAVLNSNGVAVLHISTLTPGRHSVIAIYGGDGKASPSTAPAIAFLVKQQTTLTLSSVVNPALTLDHVIVNAVLQSPKAVAATGAIVFMDGTRVVGSAPLDASGGAVIDLGLLTAGTHSITAAYAGDDADFPASSSVLPQTVQLRATRTTVSASSTNINDPQQVTLFVVVQSPTPSSVAQPGGSATLYDGTRALGTVTLDRNGAAAYTVRLEANHTASITAKYAGDASYAASDSDPTTVQAVTPAQFILTVSNSKLAVASGQHTVVAITAASVQGFADKLKLGCVGLPYAATCTFTVNGTVITNMDLAANGSGSMQLTVDTGNPLGSASEVKAQLQRSSGAVLCLLPACLLLFRRVRQRRTWPVLLLLLFAGLGSMGLTGCGGLTMNGTPAGTYTFQVTAVAQGTGITESQTVTLTVGK